MMVSLISSQRSFDIYCKEGSLGIFVTEQRIILTNGNIGRSSYIIVSGLASINHLIFLSSIILTPPNSAPLPL